MAKDLIIGFASNYTWDHLKYWVTSIKRSGFSGDIALCVTDIGKDTVQKLHEEGVKVAIYGKEQGDRFVSDGKGAPHVMRFFYIWEFLTRTANDNYRYVIMTDTRDVIFQDNPSHWLDGNMTFEKRYVASSEGLYYRDEPWGNDNLLHSLGPHFHAIYKDKVIYNVGVIAGYHHHMKDLCLMLFQLCVNRPIAICDQAMFNFLINQQPYTDSVMRTTNICRWAIQLGTTEEAVKAGSGDLGREGKFEEYKKNYLYGQPILKNGKVYYLDPITFVEKPFYLVHQWDRIPSLKMEIEREYSNV